MWLKNYQLTPWGGTREQQQWFDLAGELVPLAGGAELGRGRGNIGDGEGGAWLASANGWSAKGGNMRESARLWARGAPGRLVWSAAPRSHSSAAWHTRKGNGKWIWGARGL
jgi:hypothetical protein